MNKRSACVLVPFPAFLKRPTKPTKLKSLCKFCRFPNLLKDPQPSERACAAVALNSGYTKRSRTSDWGDDLDRLELVKWLIVDRLGLQAENLADRQKVIPARPARALCL